VGVGEGEAVKVGVSVGVAVDVGIGVVRGVWVEAGSGLLGAGAAKALPLQAVSRAEVRKRQSARRGTGLLKRGGWFPPTGLHP